MTELLSFTSRSGVRHRIEKTAEGGLIDHASFDAEPVLDRCKAMANHNDGYSPSRDIQRVAFVPDIIALKWLNEHGFWIYDAIGTGDTFAEKKLARLLNDPDYQYLRTAPGTV